MITELPPLPCGSVSKQTLEALLPPKKPDLDPRPETVDTPAYEDADPEDVRARSFVGEDADFLNRHAYSAFQFGADEEEAWTDDDDDDDMPGRPECQTQ